MNDELTLTLAKICEIGALLYTRGLTDTAGGNISARVGERICMTPATREAGSNGTCALGRYLCWIATAKGWRGRGRGPAK